MCHNRLLDSPFRPPEDGIKANRVITKLLADSRVALTNARNEADLQAALAPFGYDPARLDEGLVLIGAAEDRAHEQQTHYAERYQATDDLDKEAVAARATYARHVKLARAVFKRGTLGFDRLGLAGRRRKGRAGWMAQARPFYRALLDDAALLETMSAYTVDRAAVEAAVVALDAVEAAQARQIKEASEAQRATRERDAAVAAVRAFMSTFYVVAKVATEQHPQLREKLGMLERS